MKEVPPGKVAEAPTCIHGSIDALIRKPLPWEDVIASKPYVGGGTMFPAVAGIVECTSLARLLDWV